MNATTISGRILRITLRSGLIRDTKSEGRELRVRLDSANGFLANRPEALSKAGLVVRFELPNIDHETSLVRQMWNAGQIQNSGLLDASLSDQFLSAAKDLDTHT